MTDRLTRRGLSLDQLRAVAHPLRLRMLELLREGPSNSTVLAQRLGESSGSTSYHLRQLARYDLIEEDSDRSRGRERWWRRKETMLQFDVDRPDAEHIASYASLRATIVERDEEALGSLARREDLLKARPDNLWIGGWRLLATPDEIRALAHTVFAEVDRLRRSPEDAPPDASLTHVTFRTIPLE
jgi:DNA-binding transcriptional ArsR family regulator